MCTMAITISASGIQLPNIVIFYGTVIGQIAKSEHATYPAGTIYTTQEKLGWMLNALMSGLMKFWDHILF